MRIIDHIKRKYGAPLLAGGHVDDGEFQAHRLQSKQIRKVVINEQMNNGADKESRLLCVW